MLLALDSEWRWIAAAAAFAYAALIFSFLGGVWWGEALQAERAPRWAFAIAVLPSLIALALFLPWTIGWDWPGPALLALGLLIAASPLIDRALGFGPPEWRRLRSNLSWGLGALTFIAGLVA